MYPGGSVLPGLFDVVITVRFSGIIQKTQKTRYRYGYGNGEGYRYGNQLLSCIIRQI